ncbi:NnrU protein [Palleronia marisminoris]|uniref:NnrU protein n=1 Tax=Palleronia marisminoris TaxID=315423 RepID=A0A1Y5RW01_9RHOB|nr:NnrU family protein [Palleronia marisminoris]SFG46176.1 NnrU protein [Palleronia marisminoris]SLN25758.1 NnrU protein [Palleronia marisminoris]
MALLILGLALWIAGHVFKRVAPGTRAAMQARIDNASKGVFAVVLVIALILMVIGYRSADFIPVYMPPKWTVHLVDLLMIVAIALFGLGSSKSSLRGKIRHPQLTGLALWAALHLTVNGDLASIVLFGVLLVWALGEMALLNATTPRPEPYTEGSTKGTIRLLVISLILYAVITSVHAWLGYWPFPR